MLSNRTDTQAIENRKSRAAVPRRGMRWRPGSYRYSDCTTEKDQANELFFTKRLMTCYELGEMRDRRFGGPPLCVARKIPYFLSIHRGRTVPCKEASARGIITPLQSLGPASRSGILAKTWCTLNLGTSWSSSSTHSGE